jgi:hypothetical protein
MTTVQPQDSAETCRRENRLSRGGIAVTLLSVWILATMAGATGNTSWEHHPYAGPFILLRESRSAADFIFSLYVLAFVMVPIAAWVWTGRLWAAVLSIVVSCLSIGLSYGLAASASC